MPTTNSPTLVEWIEKLNELIDKVDKNLFLIGHSLGCITILRFLEQLKEDTKIGGVILVASPINNCGFLELQEFFEPPLDYNKVKEKAKHFTLIHSEDDPIVSIDQAHELKEKLDAKLILKQGLSHITGSTEDAGSVTELPEIAQNISNL